MTDQLNNKQCSLYLYIAGQINTLYQWTTLKSLLKSSSFDIYGKLNYQILNQALESIEFFFDFDDRYLEKIKNKVHIVKNLSQYPLKIGQVIFYHSHLFNLTKYQIDLLKKFGIYDQAEAELINNHDSRIERAYKYFKKIFDSPDCLELWQNYFKYIDGNQDQHTQTQNQLIQYYCLYILAINNSEKILEHELNYSLYFLNDNCHLFLQMPEYRQSDQVEYIDRERLKLYSQYYDQIKELESLVFMPFHDFYLHFKNLSHIKVGKNLLCKYLCQKCHLKFRFFCRHANDIRSNFGYDRVADYIFIYGNYYPWGQIGKQKTKIIYKMS